MSDQGRYGDARHGPAGAVRHLQLTLPACGQPVQLARLVTREVLTAWRLAHAEETAALLMSRLVANAARDAACADAVTVELHVVETWLRIEAYRCRPGLPAPRTAGEFALVDCVAGTWGWIAWPASARDRGA